MNDLISILKSGNASVKLEVSGEDLLEFSNELINRAKSELAAQEAKAHEEKYLTKDEVKRICEVCDATLWHWNKKGYLKTVKIGSKVRYRQSDVRKIFESRSATSKSG
jgi:predicted DNA-binding transcriptional regulator AlpA